MKKLIHGVLPDLEIAELMKDHILNGATSSRIQPASIDLVPDLDTLMVLKHYSLPRKDENVDCMISQWSKTGVAHSVKSMTLLPQTHYLVRMKESLRGSECFARVNPKSSIGRIFLQSRLLCNGVSTVDEVPVSYNGKLWTLLTPKFFPITLSPTESINQMRFFSGDARLSEHDLRRMIGYKKHIVTEPRDLFDIQKTISVTGGAIGEIPISVDLHSKCYRTKHATGRPLSLSERSVDFNEYYELIDPEEIKAGLVIDCTKGYLIGTIEQFQVPKNMAIEVMVSDKYGEIKLHFAGFVDPGFGLGIGNSITLEIVANEQGACLRHGQYVGTVRAEWMASVPSKVYAGNYTHQEAGAKLPKYLA